MSKCSCGSASVGSPRHSDWCDINTQTTGDDLQLTLAGLEAWINPDPSNPFFGLQAIPNLPKGNKKPVDQQTTSDFLLGMKIKKMPTHQNSPIYRVVAINHTLGVVYATEDNVIPGPAWSTFLPSELEVVQ